MAANHNKVNVDGNIWCGWGSNGAPCTEPEDLNGFKMHNSQGKAIGFNRPMEWCTNLFFGGAKTDRLYWPRRHSVYPPL
ncbi:sugar lactone lactonase YvrE [Rhizobium skierniewicense]|uniref:Sugar lactone lactonase YvrE n=1 Tax=Rhizobium skierniewicense TaxID=984260 RepID=A0A7W6G3R0_9HYPH|nr:hypothetical protein [Rhizobium skierniewicense]MBB3948095.1 sugar lactone lactonase YvrE [Rhizobium skierniewicense]